MSTILVRPGPSGRLVLKLPFDAERVDKIKRIPGRTWHPHEKHWTIPDGGRGLDKIRALFLDAMIDVDPALEERRATGALPCGTPRQALSAGTHVPRVEADTDLSGADLQAEIVSSMREAIQARHLSPRTAQAYTAWVQ